MNTMTDDERITAVSEAITAATRAVYGTQEPMHYGTLISWQMGGPDPLGSISIFWHPSGHWHYVALGMSELADKQTNNPGISGWGFELTFRLQAPPAVRAREGEPSAVFPGGLAINELAPMWPIALLNDIGRYVFSSRNPLAHGHFLERPGDPRGRYWGVVKDAGLARVSSVNGAFDWLTLVALDEPQFRRLQGDDFESFLTDFASANRWSVSTVDYAAR